MMEVLERPRKVLEHLPEANHYDTLERDRMAAEQSTHTTPERWLPVPGYEGYYEVSDQGRVRSVDRVIRYRTGQVRRYPAKMSAIHTDRKGYSYFWASRDGVTVKAYIHRSVLGAFGGPSNSLYSCHNDGDKSNNNFSNLRWGTQGDNMDDAVRHGTHFWAAKDHCPQGHPYSGPNLRFSEKATGGKERRCLSCVRAKNYLANHPEMKQSFQEVSDSYFDDIQRTGGKYTRAKCRRGHLLEGDNLVECDLQTGKRKCKACQYANAYSYRHRDEEVDKDMLADQYYKRFGPVTVLWETEV